jgi:hypothetical protein
VGHHTDELSRGIARQLRVGVERDHVPHVRQRRGPPDDEREAIFSRAPQKGIEVRELAPLALVTHPYPFLRIPAARTVEQEEAVTGGVTRIRIRCAPVLGVEILDALRELNSTRPPAAFPKGRPQNRSKARNRV